MKHEKTFLDEVDVPALQAEAKTCPYHQLLKTIAKVRDTFRISIGMLIEPAEVTITRMVNRVRKAFPNLPKPSKDDRFLRTGLAAKGVEDFYPNAAGILGEIDLSEITDKRYLQADILFEILRIADRKLRERTRPQDDASPPNPAYQRLGSMIAETDGTDDINQFMNGNFLFAIDIVLAMVELITNKTPDLETAKKIILSRDFRAGLKALAHNEGNVSGAFVFTTRRPYISAGRIVFDPHLFELKNDQLFFNERGSGPGSVTAWLTKIQSIDDEVPFAANICPALKAKVTSPEGKTKAVIDDFIDLLLEFLIKQYLPHAKRNNDFVRAYREVGFS